MTTAVEGAANIFYIYITFLQPALRDVAEQFLFILLVPFDILLKVSETCK